MSYKITPNVFCVSILSSDTSSNPNGYKDLDRKVTSTCNASSTHTCTGIFYATAKTDSPNDSAEWQGSNSRVSSHQNGLYGTDFHMSATVQGSSGGHGVSLLTNEVQRIYYYNNYDNDELILTESYCYTI
jgi:hypothetical protein